MKPQKHRMIGFLLSVGMLLTGCWMQNGDALSGDTPKSPVSATSEYGVTVLYEECENVYEIKEISSEKQTITAIDNSSLIYESRIANFYYDRIYFRACDSQDNESFLVFMTLTEHSSLQFRIRPRKKGITDTV
ncbi:MAG: hypothetical protein IJ449_01750 [Clostridia bacterium]|nr:hypothetical protein [Clostridia bacterium]